MSINNNKKAKTIFILGATSTILISPIIVGVSASASTSGSVTFRPINSYFNTQKKKEIADLKFKLRVNENRFFDTFDENDFWRDEIQANHQFSIHDESITTDKLIQRLRSINRFGLYDFKDNNINKINLQKDIEFIQGLKNEFSDKKLRDVIYKELADKVRNEFTRSIPNSLTQLTKFTSQQDKELKEKLAFNYQAIKDIWKISPKIFQEYAAEYIEKWFSLNKRSNNDFGAFDITLASIDPRNPKNLIYEGGSLFRSKTAEEWNNSDAKDFYSNKPLPNNKKIRKLRFSRNGIVAFDHPDTTIDLIKKTNIVFVKENISPADFVIFQLAVSGFMNGGELFNFLKANKDLTTSNQLQRIKISKNESDGGGSINLNTSNYVSETEPGEAINDDNTRDSQFAAYMSEYFNPNVFSALRGRTRTIPYVTFNLTETLGGFRYTINHPKTGILYAVAGDLTYNYDDFLARNDLPDPLFYLTKARTSDKELKAEVEKKIGYLARKYYIEKTYVAEDTDKLNASRLNIKDKYVKDRLTKTENATSYFPDLIKDYKETFARIPLISNSDFPSSLSFKWFVANRYNQNDNTPFSIVRNTVGVPRPSYANSPDFKYNTEKDYQIAVLGNNDIYANASDDMIFAYLDHIVSLNQFDVKDPVVQQILRSLYRLVRATVNLEHEMLEAKNSTAAGISANKVFLNGYEQDGTKVSYSERILLSASNVMKFYKEALQTLDKGIKDYSVNFLTNPQTSDVSTIRGIFNLFQLWFNPAQFDIDRPFVSNEGNDQVAFLVDYIRKNFKNFGNPTIAFENGIFKIPNPKDTLNGSSLEFANAQNQGKYSHASLLAQWQKETGTTPAQMTKEKFAEFVNWLYHVRYRDDIRILALNASKATTSTTADQILSIGGNNYSVNPKYPFGKLLAANEFVNLSTKSPFRLVEDMISPAQIKALNLNTADVLRELSLPSNLNFDIQQTGNNLTVLTKKYFDVKPYAEYLKEFKSTVGKAEKFIPLPPEATSKYYVGAYSKYVTDYKEYLKTFFRNEDILAETRSNVPLPKEPAVYQKSTNQNVSSYFEITQQYSRALESYSKQNAVRRNGTLKKVLSIDQTTDEGNVIRVTLRDGTIINQYDTWFDVLGNPKANRSTNPINKIEIGSNRLTVPANSPLLILKDPNNIYSRGIQSYVTGYNYYINDPENRGQKITLRNLYVRRLNKDVNSEYNAIITSLSNIYNNVKIFLNAEQLKSFNSRIEQYKRLSNNGLVLDGYNISRNNNAVIQNDVKFPWDTATSQSATLRNEISSFNVVHNTLTQLQPFTERNVKVFNKLEELLIDVIKKVNEDDRIYNAAKSNLNDFLQGRSVLNGSGALVRATEAPEPLSVLFPQKSSEIRTSVSFIDNLRLYRSGNPTIIFDFLILKLSSVTTPEYRNLLETELLKTEFANFNNVKFRINSSGSVDESITKSNWHFANVNLTDRQRTNQSEYDRAINSKTTPNSALRVLYKLISPADPNSSHFVPNRDDAINKIQSLFTSQTSFSYDPNVNAEQTLEDRNYGGLSGDISNILPNQRLSLAKKYNEALKALKIIQGDLNNIEALKETKEAINFIYANAARTVGQYNTNGTLITTSSNPISPYFNIRKNGEISTLDGSINTSNQAYILVNKAVKIIQKLAPRFSLDSNDYLASLAIISELAFQEQSIFLKRNSLTKFDWETFNKNLDDITKKINGGFSAVPRYQTNLRTSNEFRGIINASLKQLLTQKINYLKYISGWLYIQKNLISGLDLTNKNNDPTVNMNAWVAQLASFKEPGNSSYSYRSQPAQQLKLFENAIGKIYPVVSRPHDITVLNNKSDLARYLPTAQGVNELSAAIENVKALSVTQQPSYFTVAKAREIQEVQDAVGLNENNFFNTSKENTDWKALLTNKQISLKDSNLSIDQIIERLKQLQTVGLYDFDNAKINKINLQKDFDYLESLKAKANNTEVQNEVLEELRKAQINNFVNQIPESDKRISGTDSENQSELKLKLATDFTAIKQLWEISPDLFREFAAKYMQKWFNSKAAEFNNKFGYFQITLATVNPTQRNNIVYNSGSLFRSNSATEWNNTDGKSVFSNRTLSNGSSVETLRFPRNGFVIFNYPNAATANLKKANFVFIKENLTPADFVMFQMAASGFFDNETADSGNLSKLLKAHRDTLTSPQSISYTRRASEGGTTVTLPTSKFISKTQTANEAKTDNNNRNSLWQDYMDQFFNIRLYTDIRGKSRNIPFYVKPGERIPASALSSQANTTATRGVRGMMQYSIDSFILAADTPNPYPYFIRAKTSAEQLKKEIDDRYAKVAIKYFIDATYAGSDTENLNINTLGLTNEKDLERIKNTKTATNYTTKVVDDFDTIFNRLPLISNSSFPSSLSFKWFIVTHYNKQNNDPFSIIRGVTNQNIPDYINSRNLKFEYVEDNPTPVIGASDVYSNATDEMIYAYIDHIIHLNKLNINSNATKEFLRSVYRFLRSVVTYETNKRDAINSNSEGKKTNKIILNGYKQDQNESSFSEITLASASLVTRHYKELVDSLDKAIKDSTVEFANSPNMNSDNVVGLYNFFQLWMNPAQFNIDSPNSNSLSASNKWSSLVKYIADTHPNFGAPKLTTTFSRPVSNPTETLNGNSLEYGNNRTSKYNHRALLAAWQSETGTKPADMNAEKFEEFITWLFENRYRNDILKLALNASKAPTSAAADKVLSIDGVNYTVDPKYNYGHTLAVTEFTNNASPKAKNIKVDVITPTQLSSSGLNNAATLRELSLPENLDLTQQLSGDNLTKLTKKYFDVKAYNEYLNEFKAKNRTKKLIPLSPEVNSKFYANNFASYIRDYESYLATFYKDANINSNVVVVQAFPDAPEVYPVATSANVTVFLDAYVKYSKTLSELNKESAKRRNTALKQILEIPLNTDETGIYRVTLKNGTIITQSDKWFNDDGTSKANISSNPITKIEIGSNRVVVPIDSPYIVWVVNSSIYNQGIRHILPSYNFLVDDVLNPGKKISLRNLLIRRLNADANEEYQQTVDKLSNLFESIKPELSSKQVDELSSQIVELRKFLGKGLTLDGYTVTPISTPKSTIDSATPWDNATPDSSILKPNDSKTTSFVKSVEKIKPEVEHNNKILEKLDELTRIAIINVNSDEPTYNRNKLNANNFLKGITVLNSRGQVVSGSQPITPLTTLFPEKTRDADQAINSTAGLRNYSSGDNRIEFSTVTGVLSRLRNSTYKNLLITELLKSEFINFNLQKFQINSATNTPESITKSNWGFATVNLSDEQRTNLAEYKKAINTQTTANTAYRFFLESFSPADSFSKKYVVSREAAVESVQNLYTFLATAKFDPSTNAAQVAEDKVSGRLSGDIANIKVDHRLELSRRYHNARTRLQPIVGNFANVNAFRETKKTLEFLYSNPTRAIGKYDLNGAAITTTGVSAPYFAINNSNLNGTINANNEVFKQIQNLVKIIGLVPSSNVNDINDYLSSLSIISELIFEEQSLYVKRSTFGKEQWTAFHATLDGLVSKTTNAYTTVPKYQNANETSVSFKPIQIQEFKDLINQKVRYLRYVANALFVQRNLIPSLDFMQSNIDPSVDLNAWNKQLKTISQVGKSSYFYRSMSEEGLNKFNELLKMVYPVIRRTSDITSINTLASLNTFLPSEQVINDLKTKIENLPNLVNNINLLKSDYRADKNELSSLSSNLSKTLLETLLNQSKALIDINDGVASDNQFFNGVASIATTKDADYVKLIKLNVLNNSIIVNQLTKLQNVKSLNEIVQAIATYRTQYLTIGVNGVSGKKPSELKPRISSTLYSTWETLDSKANALLTLGTIPNSVDNFTSLNESAKTKVNLAPGLDASGNLIPIAFNAPNLTNNFATIRSELETLRSQLVTATNALVNVITADTLVPLLNELNGNSTVLTNGLNVYNPSVNTSSLNNTIYGLTPAEISAATTTIPNAKLKSGLANFNNIYRAVNASTTETRSQFNDFDYQDFLDSEAAKNRGPLLIKRDKTTVQNDVNNLVSFLNGKIMTQLMNVVYWANTDYEILKKFDEFLKAETTVADIKRKTYSIEEAFNKTKQFFTEEFAKANPKYLKVTGFNSNLNLNSKIPLLNFDVKMQAFNNDWRDLALKLSFSSAQILSTFNTVGQAIESISASPQISSPTLRESVIQAYGNYISGRNSLNGSTIEQFKTNLTELKNVFNSGVTKLGTDWENRVFTDKGQRDLQDALKKAKAAIMDAESNKIVNLSTLKESLSKNVEAFVPPVIPSPPVPKPMPPVTGTKPITPVVPDPSQPVTPKPVPPVVTPPITSQPSPEAPLPPINPQPGPTPPGGSTPSQPGGSTPSQPSPSDPVQPSPTPPDGTSPSQPSPSEPSQPSPTQPDGSTPTQPSPIEPSQPGPTLPGSSTPSQPSPGQPLPPITSQPDPTQPGDSTPIQPSPSDPIQPAPTPPGSSTPTQPGSSTPSEPSPSEPVQPSPIPPVTPGTGGDSGVTLPQPDAPRIPSIPGLIVPGVPRPQPSPGSPDLLDSLQPDLLKSAQNLFSNSTPINKKELNDLVENAMNLLKVAQTQLQVARNLPDSSPNKQSEIATLLKRIENINKAIETANSVNKYKELIDKIAESKVKPDVDSINDLLTSLTSAHNSETDPVIKELLNAAINQVNSIRETAISEIDSMSLVNLITNYLSDKSADKLKNFVNRLQEETRKSAEDAILFRNVKPSLENAINAINVYDRSNVNRPETIESARNAIISAKNDLSALQNNINASQLEKDIAKSTIEMLDVLLNNLNNSDVDRVAAKASLDTSIRNFSEIQNPANLDALKKAIIKANDSRVDTKAINDLLILRDKINDINKIIDMVKDGSADAQGKSDLLAILNDAKNSEAEIRAVVDPNSPTGNILNDLSKALANSDLEAKIALSDIDVVALNKDLDRRLNELISARGAVNLETLDTLFSMINNLPTSNDSQRNSKSNLQEKFAKVKNELMIKNILSNLTQTPSSSDISSLEFLSGNSLNSYRSTIQAIKNGKELDEKYNMFIKLDSKDTTIPSIISQLRTMVVSNIKMANELISSNNVVVSSYALRLLQQTNNSNNAIQTETNLFEGIRDNDETKLRLSKEAFDKLMASTNPADKKDYNELYNIVFNWLPVIKEADAGNLKSIIKVQKFRDDAAKLNNISNVVKTSIDSKLSVYNVSNSPGYAISIAGISVGIGAFLIATLVFLVKMFKRKKK